MIMLDSEGDGGVRMSSEEVTLGGIKAAFDPDEYAALAERGCER